MTQTARTTRFEARTTPENLKVLRRAAEIQGRSLSDFVMAAANEVAHRTIEQTQVIRLSVEDYEMVVEAIRNPPPPTPAMERAAARYKELVRSSE